MDITARSEGNTSTLELHGRFDLTAQQDFFAAFKAALGNRAAEEIRIDLANVEYVDSHALGMLLVSRDYAMTSRKTISLAGATGAVRSVLGVANFDKLFRIS